MQFRVGPFVYRIKMVVGYIDHQGDRCLGLCDNDRHELLISDQAGEAQQIQVICHEYMEAWLYHFGQGKLDKEGYCDLFGLAMTQFVMDLVRRPRPTDEPDAPSLSAAMAQLVAKASTPAPADQATATSIPARPSPSIPVPVNAAAVNSSRPAAGQDSRADHHRAATGEPTLRMTEQVEPARPGSPRPWRVRVFEPISPGPAGADR